MFGRNEIVGQKYFVGTQDKLFVTSIFHTLQGEGPYSGRPAVFIRLAKCNLACSFCDTFFDDGDWLNVGEIEARIRLALESTDRSKVGIVITGGEPMLQQNVGLLCKALLGNHAFVQIETNGIIYQDIPEAVTLVVSPKCAEKNGVVLSYLKPHPKMLARADCLKFVVEDKMGSPYSAVPDWAFDFTKDIYISPMNMYNDVPRDAKMLRIETGAVSMQKRSTIDEIVSFWEPGLLNMAQNQKNHEYAARYCLEHNFILSLQTHLYAGIA